MLNLVYFSNTSQNTHRFVEQLEVDAKRLRIPVRGEIEYEAGDLDSYVLFSPSYGGPQHSHVPPQVRKFLSLEQHRRGCRGVIGSGNINFGREYARAGFVIAAKLEVPMLYRFELAGTTEDVAAVTHGISALLPVSSAA